MTFPLEASEVGEVTVDYGRSLEQMIKCGMYEYVAPDITPENFPVSGEGVQRVQLFLTSRIPPRGGLNTGREIESCMKQAGLRPATLPELLAFAEASSAMFDHPIAALGSAWQRTEGRRAIPYVSVKYEQRELCLGWGGAGWRGLFRFGAVKAS